MMILFRSYFRNQLHAFAGLLTTATGGFIINSTDTQAEESQDDDLLRKMKQMSPTSPIYIFSPHASLQICYDTRTRTPLYALERLSDWKSSSSSSASSSRSSSLLWSNNNKRQRPNFVEEKSLPIIYRSRPMHYRNTNYDRGHMAPAGDFIIDEAYKGTFNLTNVCPQTPSLNRGLWNQLEQWVRRCVVQRYCCDDFQKSNHFATYIVTGPLWLPASKVRVLESGNKEHGGTDDNNWEYRYRGIGKAPCIISVPTHFFKLVVLVNENEMSIDKYAAFVMPNEDIMDDKKEGEKRRLEDFLVRWSDLEAVTGIEFFPFLVKRNETWKALADAATENLWVYSKKLLSPVPTSPLSKADNKKGNFPQHLCSGGQCE